MGVFEIIFTFIYSIQVRKAGQGLLFSKEDTTLIYPAFFHYKSIVYILS